MDTTDEAEDVDLFMLLALPLAERPSGDDERGCGCKLFVDDDLKLKLVLFFLL